MNDELEPGDVVVLRSGGPRMTLRSRNSDGDLYCNWFDGRELKEALFVEATLERGDID